VIIDQRRAKVRRKDRSSAAPQALSDHHSEGSGREPSESLQRPNQASSLEFYSSTTQSQAGISSQAQEGRPSPSAMDQSQPFGKKQFDIDWDEGDTALIMSSHLNSTTRGAMFLTDGLTTLPNGPSLSSAPPMNDQITDTISPTRTVESGKCMRALRRLSLGLAP
jgi:hypothetical protein